MGNKVFRCLKKVNKLNSKILKKKIKSRFLIYWYFKSAPVAEDNGKKNREESHISKCQKHVACSHGYKVVW